MSELVQVLAETNFHQDWLAKHVSLTNLRRRVRLYTAKRTLNAAQRSMLADAARREFQLLEGIRHPGILRASDFIDSEHGPALIFEYDEGFQRLDHFIRAQGEHLDLWQRCRLSRIGIWRRKAQAEVPRYSIRSPRASPKVLPPSWPALVGVHFPVTA